MKKKNDDIKKIQRKKQQDLKSSLEKSISSNSNNNESKGNLSAKNTQSNQEKVYKDTVSNKNTETQQEYKPKQVPLSKGKNQQGQKISTPQKIEEVKVSEPNKSKQESKNNSQPSQKVTEGSKLQNNDNESYRCYSCNKNNIEFPVYFTCNHTHCLQCLVKSLLLFQFKPIENRPNAIFPCKCHMGNAEISFEDFIAQVKLMNQPKSPGKCRKHNDNGVKYCLECELWLCNKCLEIHSEFNSMHTLEELEHPIHQICEEHGEITKFYCEVCKKEICPLCIIRHGKHYEHTYIRLEDFEILTNEIKMKFKYKNFEQLSEHLKEIEDKLIKDYDDKVKDVNNNFDEVIRLIEETKNDYNQIMEDKKKNALNVIEIIKQCFCTFYFDLNKKEQDYYTLDYLNKIIEIMTINSFFSNTDELISIQKEIKKFSSKNPFMYQINNKENPYPYILSNLENFKKSSISKYSKTKREVKRVFSIPNLPDAIYSMAKLSNGNNFAISVGKDIYIYSDIDTSTPPQILNGHQKSVLCLCEVSPTLLVSGGEDKMIKVWNTSTFACEGTITGSYERVDTMVALTETLIAVGTRNTIRVFDISTKEEKYSLIGHEKAVCSLIKVNPNVIISGSYDNSIKIWDLNDKVCDFTLFGHDQPVFVVLILKDGRLASGSGSWDKTIKIWNLKEKFCECTLVGHKREIRAMKQLKNGWLLSGSVDKTIKVWNIKKKICLQTLVGHFDVIFGLCVLNDDRFVSGGRDKELFIWKY